MISFKRDSMKNPEPKPLANNVLPFVSKKHDLYFALLQLTASERRELLAQFCLDCGSDNPHCGCTR